jgi:uncharacterized flavoprotein (TIGR03862 family)
MAADVASAGGAAVTVYDQMPSVGRKFLMAGRGGLNLTHSEDLDQFIGRYGEAEAWLGPAIRDFPPLAVRDWCHALGQSTFIGSSGRVFPRCLKASPVLRAWLRRLDKKGVRFRLKRKWLGWDNEGHLIFATPDQAREQVKANATLLALGGASWPRLGSDGGWFEILQHHNISVAPLRPANCGFIVPWSEIFRQRFEGQPLKPVTMSFDGATIQGEAIVTAKGIEGGPVYALSGALRKAIDTNGSAMLLLDLRPGLTLGELTKRLQSPRGSRSVSNHLRKFGGLTPPAVGLLNETTGAQKLRSADPPELAKMIKTCCLSLTATGGLDRAISTAGGISRDAVDERFMLRKKAGVFAAGEMLDWQAPTGGYLLQGSFSTAVAAARGMLAWIGEQTLDEAI